MDFTLMCERILMLAVCDNDDNNNNNYYYYYYYSYLIICYGYYCFTGSFIHF